MTGGKEEHTLRKASMTAFISTGPSPRYGAMTELRTYPPFKAWLSDYRLLEVFRLIHVMCFESRK